jgi:hypothetical protein
MKKKSWMRGWLGKLLVVVGIAALLSVPLMPVTVMAVTTADVTVTATPEYLAMTNSEDNWTIGNIAEAATKWWTPTGVAPAEPLVDGDMNSTIANTGSVTSDVAVHGHAFTGGVGWAITGAGADAVTMKWGITGDANIAAMTTLTTSDVDLKANLAAAGTIKWCMSLLTGTFTDGVAKSTTVTLTISKS